MSILPEAVLWNLPKIAQEVNFDQKVKIETKSGLSFKRSVNLCLMRFFARDHISAQCKIVQ